MLSQSLKKTNQNFLLNEGYKDSKILFEKGKGSKIFSEKKTYLDLSFAAGSLLLGHNSNVYVKAMKKAISTNITTFAAPNKQANDYAKLLKKIFPQYSKFIFSNSGTEAVIKSLRICKAISKKDIIIGVTGSWHGSVDKLLFFPDKKNTLKPLSDGLSYEDKKNIKFIPYNNIEMSKKILHKYKKKISCIIVEPIQGCLPSYDSKKYLKFLRNFSKNNKSILVFDEMITGLRVDCSSVQSYLKINADISTFGKCFGGGMPIGIIGISKKIEEKIKKNDLKIFFGGTFSGNSIATHIGKMTTEYIIKNKKNIFPFLKEKAIFFQNEINSFLNENEINAKCYRFESMLRIVFTNKKIRDRLQRDSCELQNIRGIKRFRNFLLDKGVYYPNNGIIFVSTKTSQSDLIKVLDLFKKGLKQFIK